MNFKQIIFSVITISVMLLASSCSGIFNRGTKGNGNVVIENRKVDVFSAIEIDGVFNVILKQGKKESVSVETDENLVDLIDVTVSEKRLVVDLKDDASIGDYTELNVFITLVDINVMDISGVGDISAENPLNLKELTLQNSGVGDIHLVLDCDELTVNNSSVGDITLSGKTNRFNLNNSGVGDIIAFDLSSQHTVVDNSGVGDVEVNANESVVIETSGVGNVKYSGHPNSESINDSGVGDVDNI